MFVSDRSGGVADRARKVLKDARRRMKKSILAEKRSELPQIVNVDRTNGLSDIISQIVIPIFEPIPLKGVREPSKYVCGPFVQCCIVGAGKLHGHVALKISYVVSLIGELLRSGDEERRKVRQLAS